MSTRNVPWLTTLSPSGNLSLLESCGTVQGWLRWQSLTPSVDYDHYLCLMYLLYTYMCECHDYWRPREDDPVRVQRSILGLWRYIDCPVWALASFLLDSRTCVPPSNERGYYVIERLKAVFWLHRVISYIYFSWERFDLRVVAVIIIIIIISPDVQITLAVVNQQYRYHLAPPSALTVVAPSNLCGFLVHASSACVCLGILSVSRELTFPWATATDIH